MFNNYHATQYKLKGADTLPTPTPTQKDHLVAMRMVYLVLLIVELFHYADEQSTLWGLHRPILLEKGQVVTEKQDLQFLTPLALFANGAGSYGSLLLHNARWTSILGNYNPFYPYHIYFCSYSYFCTPFLS